MEFSFSDEQMEVQKRVRACCEGGIAAGAAELDGASAERSQEMIAERAGILAREGLLGLGLPEEKGGAGGDLLSAVLLHQELGEACPATAISVLYSIGLCARALCMWDGGAEGDSFLKGLVAGEIIGAFGDLEPEASLDAWTLKTTAVAPGGESFALTGEKAMVLNAPAPGPKILTASQENGAGLFLVSPDASGMRISPPQTKMGCRGAPTADVSLQECPAVRLGSKDGEEAVAAMRSFEHLLCGAVAAGMTRAAMVAAGVHARDHRGGEKPLARHQEISFKLAEMFLLLDTASMLLYRSVWMMEEKLAEATVLASSAKIFASEAAVKASGWAVQITGTAGYRSGSRAERIFRDAKFLELIGHSTERHRMFLADQVLAAY